MATRVKARDTKVSAVVIQAMLMNMRWRGLVYMHNIEQIICQNLQNTKIHLSINRQRKTCQHRNILLTQTRFATSHLVH